MNIKSLFVILIFLLAGCSRAGGEYANEFKLGNMSTSTFENDKNYFIVTTFEWMGKNPATIESMELVKKDGTPITVESDRIRYAFHGADPKKAVGVYQRENLGNLEEIQGFEVEGESRLVLEVSLNHVQPASDRRIKITYTSGGKKREQLLESTTIEQLTTEE
ncbi:hypothetical protein [Saccharibacillus alkalitolerans]|uniref:DUF5067 domain-containing protein n=1 Tax=Saccharibacillus alkalitolerans TaxID=2705290 RepID=A0ABX0FCY2_9BACL|nr:hypothetical protein [Saccharibacillus alkalitolerans]NGZ77261.1 hypothetical protein [Saccharibacillus alkalitolerans]